MNIKHATLFIAAALSLAALYNVGTPRAAALALRDAPRESALDSLKTDTRAPAPAPAPVSAPQRLAGPPAAAPAFDANVPANIKQQMLQDLGFVATITGKKTSPLHTKIYGAVSGADYDRFFATRVKSVGMNNCGSATAVACVIPYSDPSKMWLTQNYIKFSHPQIARLMIVFHESRHTEERNSFWHHADCPDPFTDAQGHDVVSIWTGASLVGADGACDITPFGSYGSSAIMLKNIQRYCANCTEKVQMDAGLYADDQLNRIVDAKAKADMRADVFNKK